MALPSCQDKVLPGARVGGTAGVPPPVSLLSLPPSATRLCLKKGFVVEQGGENGERAGCCWLIPDPSSTLHHHAAVLAQHTPGPDPAQAPCLCGRRMGPLLRLLLGHSFCALGAQ